MGARVNRFGRRSWSRDTTPRIAWALRYRTCEKFGHQIYGSAPCRRCGMRRGENYFDCFTRESESIKDMIAVTADYIFKDSPFLAYLKRAAV